MPSVYIKTYGCQMNERDSEAVAAQLVAKGYSLAGSEHVADVVLLNTCSVRDMAEQKAIGKMAALAGQARKERPGQVLGFLGCMAECRELVARGVKEITLLGQIVTSYGRRGDIGTAAASEARRRFSEGASEAKAPSPLRSAGAVQKSAFVQLLEAVHEIERLERIRFTSPHPKGYGDDLVEAYARLPKLVESAHIPVQSGSDRVLKSMHRGYTRERFLGITKKLRQVQPQMGITTDFIVGFPGETEAEFEETLSLVREVEFDNAFTFKYSTRRDTP